MKISIYGSVLLLCLLCVRNSECDVKISTHDIELTEGQNKTIFLEIRYRYVWKIQLGQVSEDGVAPHGVPTSPCLDLVITENNSIKCEKEVVGTDESLIRTKPILKIASKLNTNLPIGVFSEIEEWRRKPIIYEEKIQSKAMEQHNIRSNRMNNTMKLGIIKNGFRIIHDQQTIIISTQRHFEIEHSFSNYNNERDIKFIIQHIDIVHVEPNPVPVNQPNISLVVKAVGPGHSEVYADDTNRVELEDVYFRITVNKEPFLDIISTVIGWIYFAAWSISFYPQIYTNYKRKSVVGLNFDFLALNLIGFSLYSIFNIGLYSINGIKTEYFQRNPRGLNPVQLNDIFFAVHAVLATLITIVQCCIYQREEQKVSLTAKGIVTVFALFLFGSTILALTDVIHWLDLLYYCSYVKLTITLIKYVPQAYMNYKRKSTVGWSIGNIFLDFTGGILSVLQMILNAYNYDDWASIFGDPTKFGLGFFSVIFDVFFIIQHYVLYRHTNYEENP